MNRRPASFATALLVWASLAPEAAQAHGVLADAGAFYNGLLHPAFVPAHALAVFSFGLYFGQQRVAAFRITRAAFVAALALALTAAGFGVDLDTDPALLVATASFGLLAAVDHDLSPVAKACGAAIVGTLVSLGSAPEVTDALPRLVTLLGTAVGITVLAVYAIALGEFLGRRAWTRIGSRVLGSWAAAAAVMVLSLSVFSR